MKNKEKPDRKDLSPLFDFMEKQGLREGYLLCRSHQEDIVQGGRTVKVRPLWLWALMLQ